MRLSKLTLGISCSDDHFCKDSGKVTTDKTHKLVLYEICGMKEKGGREWIHNTRVSL